MIAELNLAIYIEPDEPSEVVALCNKCIGEIADLEVYLEFLEKATPAVLLTVKNTDTCHCCGRSL